LTIFILQKISNGCCLRGALRLLATDEHRSTLMKNVAGAHREVMGMVASLRRRREVLRFAAAGRLRMTGLFLFCRKYQMGAVCAAR
jgi:hypothetical protein